MRFAEPWQTQPHQCSTAFDRREIRLTQVRKRTCNFFTWLVKKNGLNRLQYKNVANDRAQPVDVDIACLANAMASVLGLCIHRWIPVGVVEDDRVSASQVDTDASGPR